MSPLASHKTKNLVIGGKPTLWPSLWPAILTCFRTGLATALLVTLIAASHSSPSQAQTEGHFYREQSQPDVFLIDQGRKIFLPTPDSLIAFGASQTNIEVVPDGTLQRLPRVDIPSDSGTPGSIWYPPDQSKLYPLRAVPHAVVVHPRGKEVQLVQLQGWLRGVEPPTKCGDGWDFHYLFEIDTEWAERQGIDLQSIIRVGNIALQGFNLQNSHPRHAVTLPLMELELDAAGRAERAPPSNKVPSDWTSVRDCGGGDNKIFPFNPVQPDASTSIQPLEPDVSARGPYVRVYGSLVTDSPHDLQTRPGTILSRWLAITINDTAEWEGSVPDWMPGISSDDPRHYARWTEMHPPDRIEVLPPHQSRYTLRGVALAARPSALPGDLARGVSCEQGEFDLTPEDQRPAGYRIGFQELRGPETYFPWGQDADNGSFIQIFGDHVHVRAKVCGGGLGGSPGRFKALYRVWWEPVPVVTSNPPPPPPPCGDACAAERDSCMQSAHSGPERGQCAAQYRACISRCR